MEAKRRKRGQLSDSNNKEEQMEVKGGAKAEDDRMRGVKVRGCKTGEMERDKRKRRAVK